MAAHFRNSKHVIRTSFFLSFFSSFSPLSLSVSVCCPISYELVLLSSRIPPWGCKNRLKYLWVHVSEGESISFVWASKMIMLKDWLASLRSHTYPKPITMPWVWNMVINRPWDYEWQFHWEVKRQFTKRKGKGFVNQRKKKKFYTGRNNKCLQEHDNRSLQLNVKRG